MPTRPAPEEFREVSHRAIGIQGPKLDGQSSFHLPCDPCDVRRVRRPDRVLAAPFLPERDEQVLAAEDGGIHRHPVTLDDSAGLESAESFADRGCGQGKATTEGLEALPGVLVEKGKETEVLRIHGEPMRFGLLNLPEPKVAANEPPNPLNEVEAP